MAMTMLCRRVEDGGEEAGVHLPAVGVEGGGGPGHLQLHLPAQPADTAHQQRLPGRTM